MDTVCDAKRVRHQIERMEKYMAELERKACDYTGTWRRSWT